VVEGYPTAVWNIDSFNVAFLERHEHLNANPLPFFKQKELAKAKKENALLENPNQQKSRFVIVNPDGDSEADRQDSTYKLNEKEEEEKIRNYKSGYRNIQDYDEDEPWAEANDAYNALAAYRETLERPPTSSITLEEYVQDTSALHLARPFEIIKKERQFRAKMWIYNTVGDPDTDLNIIPFRPETLYPLFSLMGQGNEHFRAFHEFFRFQLPQGFPIQIQIPIGLLPIAAQVKFSNIITECDKPNEWFKIPQPEDGYKNGEVIKATRYA
jgi:hypothetical protein